MGHQFKIKRIILAIKVKCKQKFHSLVLLFNSFRWVCELCSQTIWIFLHPSLALNRRILPSDALLGTDLWPGKRYWQPVSYSHTHSYTLKQKQGPSALSPHGPKTHTWIETGQRPPSSTGTHPRMHTLAYSMDMHIHTDQNWVKWIYTERWIHPYKKKSK